MLSRVDSICWTGNMFEFLTCCKIPQPQKVLSRGWAWCSVNHQRQAEDTQLAQGSSLKPPHAYCSGSACTGAGALMEQQLLWENLVMALGVCRLCWWDGLPGSGWWQPSHWTLSSQLLGVRGHRTEIFGALGFEELWTWAVLCFAQCTGLSFLLKGKQVVWAFRCQQQMLLLNPSALWGIICYCTHPMHQLSCG